MALNTYLYPRRRSRLSVGQHAFEINGGGNVSLFLKHAIAKPSVHDCFGKELWSGSSADESEGGRAGPVSQRTACLGDVLSGPGIFRAWRSSS
jgi:hypothetical protein